MNPHPTLILVMGVSGAGKPTFGLRLAEALGGTFVEGDDHHPPENGARMASGLPLTDADRAPWLNALAHHIDRWLTSQTPIVLSCSALKRRYRSTLKIPHLPTQTNLSPRPHHALH